MKIWVDADACPVVIKELLYRAAERTEIQMTLVANRGLRVPESEFISTLKVGAGLDVADEEIVKLVEEGDLVITADIPLAAVAKGGVGLNPRGELYTNQNIGSRLAMRDIMDSLRGSGIETSGPPPLNDKARHEFANNLDKLLVASKKRKL